MGTVHRGSQECQGNSKNPRSCDEERAEADVGCQERHHLAWNNELNRPGFRERPTWQKPHRAVSKRGQHRSCSSGPHLRRPPGLMCPNQVQRCRLWKAGSLETVLGRDGEGGRAQGPTEAVFSIPCVHTGLTSDPQVLPVAARAHLATLEVG